MIRIGDKITDRTVNLRDFSLADQLTLSKYPTFTVDSQGNAYYSFDGVDDYISDLPTLPETYTFTAALSSSGSPYPVIQQDNDDTLHGDLTTEGGHTGYVHSMILHSGVLNTLQLYHDEYQHLYNLRRGRAFGAYHRLITEGSCQLVVFFDYASDPYTDFSKNAFNGTETNLTQQGTDGTEWTASNSTQSHADNVNLRLSQGTIFISLKGSSDVVTGTLIDKGTSYKLTTSSAVDSPLQVALNFNGSSATKSQITDFDSVAVTFKNGFKPRFFFNGEFFDEGSTVVTVDDTDTSPLDIGNNNELNDETPYYLKQVAVINRPLTDKEVKAMHEQALVTNAAS